AGTVNVAVAPGTFTQAMELVEVAIVSRMALTATNTVAFSVVAAARGVPSAEVSRVTTTDAADLRLKVFSGKASEFKIVLLSSIFFFPPKGPPPPSQTEPLSRPPWPGGRDRSSRPGKPGGKQPAAAGKTRSLLAGRGRLSLS